MAFTLPDLVSSCHQVSRGVTDLNNWLVNNYLKCNGEKTDALFICSRQMACMVDFPKIHIIDADIQPSSSVRNLGVIFDSTFSFKDHVSMCVRSANFHLRNIGKIRSYLSMDAARTYVQALITSRLDYCNALLYGLPKSTVMPLQRVQNNAARLVSRTKKFSSITPVLKELHWLPIQQRTKFKVLLMTFKCIHDLAPAYLCDLIHVSAPVRQLRSSSYLTLSVPRINTTSLGGRAFSVCGPQLWNQLPGTLRNIQSLPLFRKHLKHYLFAEAFPSLQPL